MTLSVGTKKNSACLSTNFLISHGQATRSTFTLSRVIHFIIAVLFSSLRIWSLGQPKPSSERVRCLLKRPGLGQSVRALQALGPPAKTDQGRGVFLDMNVSRCKTYYAHFLELQSEEFVRKSSV